MHSSSGKNKDLIFGPKSLGFFAGICCKFGLE